MGSVALRALAGAVALGLGGGAVVTGSADASLPSPMWLGVERIVIACHFDSVEQTLSDSLCRQLVDEAARLSAYPVAAATAGDLARDPGRMREQDRQLVLHVDARIEGEGRRAALMMAVRPERLGLRAWRGEASRPQRVQLRWEDGSARLQGPVTPLSQYLSELPRDRELPLPPRSDRL